MAFEPKASRDGKVVPAHEWGTLYPTDGRPPFITVDNHFEVLEKASMEVLEGFKMGSYSKYLRAKTAGLLPEFPVHHVKRQMDSGTWSGSFTSRYFHDRGFNVRFDYARTGRYSGWGEIPDPVHTADALPTYGELMERLTMLDDRPLIYNLILELGELAYSAIQTALSMLARAWRQPSFPTTVGEAIGSGADAHLIHDFAIAPTIGEFQIIYEKAVSLMDRWEALHRRVGTPTTLSFKDSVGKKVPNEPIQPKDIPSLFGTYSETIGSCKYELRRKVVSISKCRVVVIPGQIPPCPFSAEIYSLRSFGFDRILGTVWEAIPFSFVIDWLTGIGRSINTLDLDLTGAYGVPQIVKASISFKTTVEWESFIREETFSLGGALVGKKCGSGSTTVYNRRPVYFFPVFPPFEGRLRLRNMMQSLSLLTQRLRTHPALNTTRIVRVPPRRRRRR